MSPSRTLAFLAGLACLLSPAMGAGAEGAPQPAIVVVGTGSVSAAPDHVQLQVGAVTTDSSAGRALSENSAIVQRLRTALGNAGIADKDVQTLQLDVSPQYNHRQRGDEAQKIVGYRATNVLEVKVRDIGSVGSLLDNLVRAGANVLQNIRFSVDDPTALLDRARRAAVADAQRKAKLLASEAGVTLGPVLHMQEGTASPVQPFARAAALAEAAVPVAPGEQTYTAVITVHYAIGEH